MQTNNSRVLVIAEAGVNHNGDLAMAKALVDAAAESGADIVKFQSFVASRLVTKHAAAAPYQQSVGSPESQLDMLASLELTEEMHEAIHAHCRQVGIEFLSTGFDIASVRYLQGLGVRMLKVPSGEITNLPYLRVVGAAAATVILSTGMATLGEVDSAVTVLEESGTPRTSIVALHCNTEYPTPMKDVNLRAMATMGQALGVRFGYSDHTLGIEVPTAAVAMGAEVIEKHLTLNRNLPGPDHHASLEPVEFGAMVRAIRNIEVALGDGIKRPTLSERRNIPAARKSLVAQRPILEGEAFDVDNLAVKRPGTGLSPMRWDEIIGRPACRDFDTDELIEL